MKPGRKVEVAAALSYNGAAKTAPQLSGLGLNLQAKEILAIARRYGIPVRRDEGLAKKLAELREAEVIPAELYDEVARLFIDLGIE